MKRTPIRRKRSRARRGGLKDAAFQSWAHQTQPCLVAARGFGGCAGAMTFHHVRSFGSPKNDRRGVMLCAAHHLHDMGPDSIERGKQRFCEKFGIDLEHEIGRYNGLYELFTFASLKDVIVLGSTKHLK